MALTEKEARALIEELKRCAEKKIEFPSVGQKQEFYTYSMDNRHQYTIHIYRGKINRLKYNISARLYSDVRIFRNSTEFRTDENTEVIILVSST